MGESCIFCRDRSPQRQGSGGSVGTVPFRAEVEGLAAVTANIGLPELVSWGQIEVTVS